MYFYRAFGLGISSEIELPELISSDSGNDVIIVTGKTPDKLESPIKTGIRYEAAENQFLLTVDNVARYYVTNGKQIIVEPYNNNDMASIRLFLLGSAFGALIIQRNLIPMHASSVKIKNFAVLFSGISGVGKSTIAAGFYKRNYTVLDDDVSVVNIINDIPNVVPGYPQIKLWADVLNHFDEMPENLIKVRSNIKKFCYKIKNFDNHQYPIKYIFILQTKNSGNIEIKKLKGIDKFNVLRNNTYRVQFIEGLDKQKVHFKTLEKMARNCKIYTVKRPRTGFLLDALIDNILKTFDN
ncbi:MAG: hypothetical protein Kow0068_25700 [Marinilabiliales bacterium]